jgi:hypothetical protein
MAKPVSQSPFLDNCKCLGYINGEKRWKSADGKRIYTWDATHGEVEVFNQRGHHIAVLDGMTGLPKKKDAVRGRKIDV